MDRLDISGNLNRLDEVLDSKIKKNRFKFIFHDLKAEINSQLRSQIGKVNDIYHLAASSHVNRSIEDPLSFVMDNVVGTCNLLNFARGLDSLDYIQNFSTDEVFGDAQEGEFFNEWDKHTPKNPYSASKTGAAALGIAFHNTYKLPIVTTCCMNIIGERQHPEKFFPLCIKRILNDQIIDIHSYKNREKSGTRFYIHAYNVSDVSFFLRQHGVPGDDYNLVGQKEVSNLELVQMIGSILNKNVQYRMVDFHSSRPGHDLRYALKDNKIHKMNYKYPLDFEESVTQIVEWTIKNDRWLKG